MLCCLKIFFVTITQVFEAGALHLPQIRSNVPWIALMAIHFLLRKKPEHWTHSAIYIPAPEKIFLLTITQALGFS